MLPDTTVRPPATRTEARRRIEQRSVELERQNAAQRETVCEIAFVRSQLEALAAGSPVKLALADRLAELLERLADEQLDTQAAADRLLGARADLAIFDVQLPARRPRAA